MKLTNRETQILETLTKKGSMGQGELGESLNFKKSNISRHIKKLVELGLVKTKRERKKTIFINSAIIDAYSKLTNPHVRKIAFSALTGVNPYLISYLFEFRDGFKIQQTLLPIASAKRVLNKLRNLGIVSLKKKGLYIIRDEMESLTQFSYDILYWVHLFQIRASFQEIQSFFVSQDPREWSILFSTPNKSEDFFKTAFDLFSKYEVQLILTKTHYYCNNKPKIEDVVIHTLIVSPDVRGLAYVCGLIIKNHISFKKLKRTKYRFGIKDSFLDSLEGFIKSKGKITSESFPSWKEVEVIAYG